MKNKKIMIVLFAIASMVTSYNSIAMKKKPSELTQNIPTSANDEDSISDDEDYVYDDDYHASDQDDESQNIILLNKYAAQKTKIVKLMRESLN
ncbi:hypothetical protein KAH94_00215 [bacterium]|nr:hypothetical protein [bacterium]